MLLIQKKYHGHTGLNQAFKFVEIQFFMTRISVRSGGSDRSKGELPVPDFVSIDYRSGTVNSNTVNSKFHLIRSFCQIFARFLSFHV